MASPPGAPPQGTTTNVDDGTAPEEVLAFMDAMVMFQFFGDESRAADIAEFEHIGAVFCEVQVPLTSSLTLTASEETENYRTSPESALDVRTCIYACVMANEIHKRGCNLAMLVGARCNLYKLPARPTGCVPQNGTATFFHGSSINASSSNSSSNASVHLNVSDDPGVAVQSPSGLGLTDTEWTVVSIAATTLLGSMLCVCALRWRRRRRLKQKEPPSTGSPTKTTVGRPGLDWHQLQSSSAPDKISSEGVVVAEQQDSAPASGTCVSDGKAVSLEKLKELGEREHWLIEESKVELFDIVGEGSFGRVHKGSLSGYTDVAVKVSKRDAAWSRSIDASFVREVQVMRRLRHPNVVLFQGAVLTESLGMYIVMEWVEGSNLVDFLRSDLKSAACPLLRDAAKGLHYLHSVTPAILHRDLKPGNVLVDQQRSPHIAKLSDFGLSLVLHKDGEKRAGTRRYMAPEVAAGQRYGVAADIYSFGVMLQDYLHCVPEQPPVALASHEDVRRCAEACQMAEPSARPLLSEVLAVFGLVLDAAPHEAATALKPEVLDQPGRLPPTSDADTALGEFEMLCIGNFVHGGAPKDEPAGL